MRVWHRLAFGLAVLSWSCGAVTAQPPGGGPPSPAPVEKSETFVLLLNGSVQDDLGLDKGQRDRLRQLPDAVRARYQKQRAELQQHLQAMREKSAKAQEEYFQGIDAAVGRVLKPEQVRRLKQVELQSQGLALFEDRAVAAELRLTDKQKEDIAKTLADLGKTQADLLAQGGPMAVREIGMHRQAAFNEIVGALTDEQKKVLHGLAGKQSPTAARVFPLGMVGRIPDAVRRSVRLALLSSPELAEELKLGDGQADELKAAVKELQAKAKKALTPAEGDPPQLLLSRLEQKMADEARTEAEDEVLQPAQKRRLGQLVLQARGLPAFEDVAVLRALKLTPEQAKAVEAAGQKIARKRQELARELSKAGVSLREVVERLTRSEGELHQKALAGLVAGFDDAQKGAWQELTGKALDFAKAGITPLAAEVSPARAFVNEANASYFRGEFDKALAGFDEALHLDADNALACNGKAWLLATCPEEKYRDGLEAIRLAKKACAATHDKVATYLDTLAAAYAEAGEFEEAVTTQTRALEIAAPQERAEFAFRLKLFREKKKYRETPGKGAP